MKAEASVGVRRPVRFAIVGLLNTAVDLGLFGLLSACGVEILLANLVSTSAGLATSWVGNRRFVFRPDGAYWSTLTKFVLVTGTGLWVVQPLLLVGVAHALERLGDGLLWSAFLPKLVAIAAGVLWNYVAYSHIVFRPSRRPRRLASVGSSSEMELI